ALRGAPNGPATEHMTFSDKISEFELSPDGKKVAFVVHGEVFAVSAKDGGDAFRVTRTTANESGVTWSPDSRKIVYLSDRDGATHLFLYDFGAGKEAQLTHTGTDALPVVSPDGKTIAFLRDGRELRAIDVDGKNERLLAKGYFDPPPILDDRSVVWSPDSKWVAYLSYGDRLYRNASVVPAAGGESKSVSFLANGGSGAISWSPDGTYLLFITGQRTEEGQVARVDLVPHTPKFREDEFRDLFKEETPKTKPPATPSDEKPKSDEQSAKPDEKAAPEKKPAPKPVVIDFDGVRNRLTFLRLGLDVADQTVSPDGKTLVFTGRTAGQVNLYSYSLDELSKEPPVVRQVTSTSGSKAAAQFTPDDKEVFYLEDDRIHSVTLESRQTKPLAVSAEMDVDFPKEKLEVFAQAWTILRDNFFDPNFNGVNWEHVRAEYEPLVDGAQTPEEMGSLMNLMVGELNASHLGFTPNSRPAEHNTGRLGVRWDAALYGNSGRLRIADVVPLGPAAVSGLKVGDEILAVDGVSVGPRVNLDELLDHKIDRRVVLKLARDKDSEVIIRPIASGAERQLLYRQWVEQQRAYVEKISGGKLGYVHMVNMSEGALQQLYIDL